MKGVPQLFCCYCCFVVVVVVVVVLFCFCFCLFVCWGVCSYVSDLGIKVMCQISYVFRVRYHINMKTNTPSYLVTNFGQLLFLINLFFFFFFFFFQISEHLGFALVLCIFMIMICTDHRE